MNNESSIDARSEVTADDSDVRSRDLPQPLPYNMCVQREVVAQQSIQAVAQQVAREAEARHAHVIHAVQTDAQGQVDQANSRMSAAELEANAKLEHMHKIMQKQLAQQQYE